MDVLAELRLLPEVQSLEIQDHSLVQNIYIYPAALGTLNFGTLNLRDKPLRPSFTLYTYVHSGEALLIYSAVYRFL